MSNLKTFANVMIEFGAGVLVGGAAGYGVKHFGQTDSFSEYESSGIIYQVKNVINSVLPSTALVAGATSDIARKFIGKGQDSLEKRIGGTLAGIGFVAGYGMGYLL